MMKKVWLVLLAVVLVFGLVVSCGGGGDGDKDKDKEGDKTGFTSDLTGLNVKLVKNPYAEDKDDSRGLQGKFENKALMQGNKISAGDEFTLKLTIKLDKTLDYPLEIGFVDTTVGESEGYWRTLTWNKDDSADDMYKIPKEELIADTEIEKEIKLTAWQGSTGAAAAANSLVFESRDVWTKDPVTITFVSFIFVAGDGGEGEPPEPPAPPEDPSFNVTVAGVAKKASVEGVGGDVAIIEGGFEYSTDSPNYQGTYACFSVDLGEALSEFATITFTAEATVSDGNNNKYKKFKLWASKTPISGGQWNSGSMEIQEGTESTQYVSGSQDMSMGIDSTKITTVGVASESVVYFVIYWPMDSNSGAATNRITNIAFVK